MFLVYSISGTTSTPQNFTLSLHVITPMEGVLKYPVAVAGQCPRKSATFLIYVYRLLYVSNLRVSQQNIFQCLSARFETWICSLVQSSAPRLREIFSTELSASWMVAVLRSTATTKKTVASDWSQLCGWMANVVTTKPSYLSTHCWWYGNVEHWIAICMELECLEAALAVTFPNRLVHTRVPYKSCRLWLADHSQYQ